MKKILFTILLSGEIFTGSAQTLITENFDALSAGNFATTSSITYATTTAAQNGWSIISNMQVPQQSNFQIENVMANDNRFAMSGSPIATGSPYSGSNYVQKTLNWSTRTNGNDIAYAECLFNTGVASTSKNEFYFGLYNANKSKCLGGFIYVRDTKLLKGLAYDSTNSTTSGNYTYSSIGIGNTALILNDNTDYYLVVGYDINTGKTSWFVSLYSIQNVALCNGSRQNNTIVSDASLLVTAAKAGTLNNSSSTVYFDNISAQARACFNFNTLADANFSYAPGVHCLGSSNLIPTLISPSSTGVFTSTPAGLSINSTSGVINMNTSAAGNYSITFMTNNASTCLDSITNLITISSSTTPTFIIPDLICTGASAPILATTSNNSVTGTWSPSLVGNTATGTYVFSPTSGQCALPVSITVNVVPTPLSPTFSIATSICSGTTAPVLPSVSTNSVSGTWTPSIVSNSADGTYIFTPTSGSCATTATAAVTIASNVTPIFNITPTICSGATAPLLSLTSTNAITGTWTPAVVSNTSSGSYVFTPTSGSCATITTAAVSITSNVTPTFNSVPSICSGETAPVLETTSTNSISGTWMPTTVSNTETGTYIFTPISGSCTVSTSTIVTVLDCADIEENTISAFSIFPNPAIDKIFITISGLADKKGKIRLLSMDGKIIEERFFSNLSVEEFDVHLLESGFYFITINDQIEKIVIQ